MDAKDERDVEIFVARENPAQSVRSKFQREEPEGVGERQKNQVMITSTERGKMRLSEVKNN